MPTPTERGPRWRRRPQHRPDEILSAAMQVFADRGLAGARVEDIAAEAGISKGTLYLYFKGKEELFKEAVRAQVRRTLEGLSAAAPPGEPTERLARFMEAYWGHLRRPAFGKLYRLVLGELNQFPELRRFYSEEVSGRVLALTGEIVSAGVAAGTFRKVDPAVASRMVVGLMIQHAVWLSQRDLFPHLGRRADEQLLGDIKDFVFAGLMRTEDQAGEEAS